MNAFFMRKSLAVKKFRQSIVESLENGYTVIIDLCVNNWDERMAGKC